MDRNNNISVVVFALCIFLQGCKGGEKKEFLGDLPPVKVEFKDVVGKYTYVPKIYQDKEINYYFDDYQVFQLKKGDTLKLEIKSDSTFYFNHFYYDNVKKIDNYKGKLKKEYGFYTFSIPYPFDNNFSNQGFIKSKDGLYFYTRLKMKGFENYEYQLFYKKIK